ncbi:hypothetical protein O181_028675 [Austropuccinia psidii MF-1]|uniref:Uncharacterized protein n=1 Tax=Austropuccinia psidii MF-1 TaxID=1389203 RepID=A0A9Q3CTT3_9BASI|nr:hypothetical protein [Austropuccinia psidii MF-1]
MEAQSNAAKYKSVLKKVRPVNEAMPQGLNTPLERPELSRDPYETSLSPSPPLFLETLKVTEEIISMISFGPSGCLSEEETNLLKNFILLSEKAIAFFISHEPWKKKPIPIPKSILPQFIEPVRERICTGLYEKSTSSYNSQVFCVAKPNRELRIVHDLQDFNKVTIKDAGLPSNVDEFVGSFSGRACYGLGYIMGGYGERELDINTRPLTTFETPLGRLQLTRLPQGETNSVAVYQAQMTWILQEERPNHLGIFIDDGGIKGPSSTYQHKTLKENPLISGFVWEYVVTLEKILFRIEEAGLTISGSKFSFCVLALDIVGNVVSLGG